MAQEQAKSPPGAAGPKDKASNPLEAMTRPREEKPGDKPPVEQEPERSIRTSLAERLKAEQRKRDGGELRREGGEPKREEPPKATREMPKFGEGPSQGASAPPRQTARAHRPAGPAPQRRLSTPANDDVPSIGGLIFALQQQPSRAPFLVALIASVAWFLIGGFFAFGLIANQVSSSGASVLGSPTALTAAVAILVPIAIFWFLALLVWRAQELRLMASAMTEVAVRLAEPDRLAEQSVASVGQTIRRQVAAMNDAISRAIGRASELEAMVHSEVAALERSYGENESRVRNLINELATEREALANNSQRVSDALKGVGTQIARDISTASATIDKKLAERGVQLTELLVSRSSEAAEQVHKAQARVAEAVPGLIERLGKDQGRLTEVIEGATQNLAALENTVAQRTNALDKTMKEGTEAMQASLAARIEGLETSVAQGALLLDKTMKDRTDSFVGLVSQSAVVLDKTLTDRTAQFLTAINQGAIALDKTLAERAETFTNSLFQRVKSLETAIGEQTTTLDRTMTERAQVVIMALAERLQSIDATFSQRTAEADRMLGEHVRFTAETFDKQTAQLSQVLANNSDIIQQTANQVGAQSKEAVSVLTSQTQTLREVSSGLLEQIHGLTQRFENQGQAILTAAKALDSSNTKIDSILEGRHQSIVALLHTVNTKAQDLDNMMRSYAGMVDNALTQAETRAKQVGTALARDTAGQAQAALTQIERLREEAQGHTARAVNDLKGSFETVITQIGRQLEQMRGQFDNTSRGMRETAQQTASDLESLRQDMQQRMEALPEHTAQATAAIRKALSEQLREIEAITPVLTRAAAPPVPAPDPYLQAQAPRPAQPPFDAGPLPQFDTRSRQLAQPEGGDIGQVASGLAQQLASASYTPPQGQGYASGSQSLGAQPAPPAQAGGPLRLDEIARAIDYRTATEIWQRFRAGERGILGRHIYNPDGQATFDEISRRYGHEGEFRLTVDRYIADFERLLGEAEASDPDARMLQNYLTSESGRVYLLLAHASGRVR